MKYKKSTNKGKKIARILKSIEAAEAKQKNIKFFRVGFSKNFTAVYIDIMNRDKNTKSLLF